MTRDALIMMTVAVVAGAIGVVTLFGRAKSESQVYIRRIVGTMLVALSVVLVANALSLESWSVGP